MSTIKKFEDLECWQLARELDKSIFKITRQPPLSVDYKLKDQMLGSSGSVMDNISEGFERNGNREFGQFLSIAKGSCGELKSQLYRAFDRSYITSEEFETVYLKADVISKKVGGLMSYIIGSEYKGSKFK